MTDGLACVSNAEEALELTKAHFTARDMVKAALECVTKETKTGRGAAYHIPPALSDVAIQLTLIELERRGFGADLVHTCSSTGSRFIRISW